MGYDFHGTWDASTNFNAPLFRASTDPADAGLNVDAAVQNYLSTGVPPEKLVLGLPFYGKGWSGVADVDYGLYQPASGAAPGTDQIVVTSSGGQAGNSIAYHVESGVQVPVTFNVTGTSTSPGDEIYLAGNDDELGNWSTDTSVAIGPLLDPNYPTWFSMASVPAGATIQYKFFIKKADGSIVWEGGSNHTYTAPTSGTGSVTVAWQN